VSVAIDVYDLLLLAHVLLFVYWLGADLAVLYSAPYAASPRYGIETRLVIARIMGFVDLFPRISVPLIGAVGATLANMSGQMAMSAVTLAAIWGAALTWVLLNLRIYVQRHAPERATRLRRLDVALRTAVGTASAIAGVTAILGFGVTGNRSIALKLVVYAVAIFLSLVLRANFRPFRPALSRLASGQAQSSDDEIMQRSLSRARPVVLAIWALTIVAAALGLWQPV
jgi:hypothetical protein